ncbi:MAG: response regulator, partial [Alphaproteobacteria bacterium]|nr:response regulator [Alphaproteobacteria bacterium]
KADELPSTALLLAPSEHFQPLLSRWLEWSGYLVTPITLSDWPRVIDDFATQARSPYSLLLIGSGLPESDALSLLQPMQALLGKLADKVAVVAGTEQPALQTQLLDYPQFHPITPPLLPLPLIKSLGDNPNPAPQNRPIEAITTPNPMPPAKVLVAEDVIFNQRIAEEFLVNLGFQVVLANDGAEALAKAADPSIDLILMDCQMPVMDGYQAAQAISQKQQAGDYRRIPIIALTAHAMVGDRENCLAAGMTDYLTKPLKKAVLKAMLERHLLQTDLPDPNGTKQG